MTSPSAFAEAVSAENPDPSRETPRRFWDPSRKLIASLRAYQAARGPLAPLARRVHVLRHRFWSAVTGADVPLNCQIGIGFVMPHPNGVVINPKALIGCNCLFFQQVTIGGPAIIGGHVDIGAGAKVLGRIEIGDHVQIGANAVVTSNVASHQVMVGIPARPKEA